MSGPTYPKRGSIEIDGRKLTYKLIRSSETIKPALISVPYVDGYEAFVSYKRYKTTDSLTLLQMNNNDKGEYIATLPPLPPAGKYAYSVFYKNNHHTIYLNNKDVIIRFKGTVPSWILILHIFFMFFAMLLSNFTGILALRKRKSILTWAKLTVLFLIIGGFILGPVVQNYAFGEYWTGFPFGYDLTDNKVLLSFIFWIISWRMYRKKQNPKWFLLASIVTLAIYLIPHSLFGSELDFVTGTVKQG